MYMLDSQDQNTQSALSMSGHFGLILQNSRAFLRVKAWFKVKVMGLRVHMLVG